MPERQRRYKRRQRDAGLCTNGDKNPLSALSDWYCAPCQDRIARAQREAKAAAAHERLAQGQWRLR